MTSTIFKGTNFSCDLIHLRTISKVSSSQLNLIYEGVAEPVVIITNRRALDYDALFHAGRSKEYNPEGLAIRVFRDGSVYPSADLVALLNLEYPAAVAVGKTALPLKDGETEADTKYRTVFEVANDTSMGLDIIDSGLFPAFKVGQRVLLANVVLKSQPKVDLFGRVDYEEDGTPKSSVLDQGSKTFGADSLIPMLQEVYGVKLATRTETPGKDAEGKDIIIKGWSEGVQYVDLTFVANPVTGEPWAKEVTYVPKKISRGAGKGQVTTQRRESAKLYVIMPIDKLTGEPKDEDKGATAIADDAPSPSIQQGPATAYEAPVSEAEALTAREAEVVSNSPFAG